MEVGVQVRENVLGHAAWFSISNGPVQRFSARWENIGSVNCNVRPRIDIYGVADNGSLGDLAYTAWGSQEPVMSGGSQEWEIFSALPEGNYAAVLRTYHCNEIFEEEPLLFASPGGAGGSGLGVSSVDVHDGYVDVSVSGGQGRDIAVIPESYPRGWIFQSARTDESGRARLDFVPVGEQGAVNIEVFSLDGESYGSREFSLVIPEEVQSPWTMAALGFGAAALLIIVLYSTRTIIKIWRR
jgi:hypothetical protein